MKFLTINGGVEELPYGQVVDTFVDALRFSAFLEKRLEDGPGLDDVFALFPELPNLLDIWNGREVFAAQFLDLTTEEAQAAVKEIAEKVDVPTSEVMEKGLAALSIASKAYRIYRNTREDVESLIVDAKLLFS